MAGIIAVFYISTDSVLSQSCVLPYVFLIIFFQRVERIYTVFNIFCICFTVSKLRCFEINFHIVENYIHFAENII